MITRLIIMRRKGVSISTRGSIECKPDKPKPKPEEFIKEGEFKV